MPTPTYLKSRQSPVMTHPRKQLRAHIVNRHSDSQRKGKNVRSHPQTGPKHNPTSLGPLTKTNVRTSTKKHSSGFHQKGFPRAQPCIFQKTSKIQRTCTCQNVNAFQKPRTHHRPCNFSKSHKTLKTLKYPSLGLKFDYNSIYATSAHASIKHSTVAPSSKLVWVPKLTV